jgi:hypothetical protein
MCSTRTYCNKKITKVQSGERVNLFAKLTINSSIEENDEKVVLTSEQCAICDENEDSVAFAAFNPMKLGKNNHNNFSNSTANRDDATNHSWADNSSTVSVNSYARSNRNIKVVARQTIAEPEFGLSRSSIHPTLTGNDIMQAIGTSGQMRNTRLSKALRPGEFSNGDMVAVDSLQKKNSIFAQKSKVINPHGIQSSRGIHQKADLSVYPECECLKAYYNYKATKLRVTYLSYVRFADGANSLLKAETFWQIPFENAISLNIHLKNNKIKLNESLVLTLVFKNLLTQELELVIDESSFQFVYSQGDDKNFGALIMENKISRNVYIGPLTQDSVSFCFMPVKCGMIELEAIKVQDLKTRKDFKFQCGYKILIN